MAAAVFRGKDRIGIEEKPIPACGPNDAVIKVTLTTICGTDLHIVREEFPVDLGRTVGHEHVGVIHEIGEAPASTASRIVKPSAPGTRTSGR